MRGDALPLRRSRALLWLFLSLRTGGTNIGIMIVGNRETYGEYVPYHMMPSEKDFIDAVIDMCNDK